MRRKAVTLLGFSAGAVAGTLLYRRGTRSRRERIALYFADGSMVSLAEGAPPTATLLPIARRILDAAHNGR
jgi:hypothetical protein